MTSCSLCFMVSTLAALSLVAAMNINRLDPSLVDFQSDDACVNHPEKCMLADMAGVSVDTIDRVIAQSNQLMQSKARPMNPEINGANNVQLRDAVKQIYSLWPNGVVPYEVDSVFTQNHRDVINAAFSEYHEKTCIQFVPRTTQSDYIFIAGMRSGCNSPIGRIGGKQIVSISIADNCVHRSVILHELMHTIGFFHEQDRADRDQYVTINWANIIDGLEGIFYKHSWDEMQFLGPYDFDSLMHYTSDAFSKSDWADRTVKSLQDVNAERNGFDTIIPLTNNVNMSPKQDFSKYDLIKIGKLYNCSTIDSAQGRRQKQAPETSARALDTASCVDRAEHCLFWSDSGYCTHSQFTDYMTEMCPHACNRCTPTVYCSDSERLETCTEWRDRGYCAVSNAYSWHVRSVCRKTCTVC